MVYSFQLTYHKILDILDLNYIPTKRIGRSLKPDIYHIDDTNDTLKNNLLDSVEISIAIDEKKTLIQFKK